MTDFSGILHGVRVIEIAEGIAGPVCGMQLADLGASVIKVEPPAGDRARGWGPPFVDGTSAIFAHLNRGKRSITLDWGVDADRSVLDGLVQDADAIIVHMDPADRRRLGIDWVRRAEENRHLIVCELTDLGPEGPYAERPGSELVIQALAGFTRYAGSPDEPCRLGYEVASVSSGMGAVQAVLAMLYKRGRSGIGDYCHLPMLGQLLSLKALLVASQSDPDRWQGFHLNGPHWPPDIGWETSDGQVTFDFRHGQRDAWVTFCESVGLGDLTDDPEYEDWRSTIYIGDRKDSHGAVYRPVFKQMSSKEASDLINGFGGISVKFHDYKETLSHPQVEVLMPFIDVPGAGPGAERQIRTPFIFENGFVADPAPNPAPKLGADRDAVVAEIRQHSGGARR